MNIYLKNAKYKKITIMDNNIIDGMNNNFNKNFIIKDVGNLVPFNLAWIKSSLLK